MRLRHTFTAAVSLTSLILVGVALAIATSSFVAGDRAITVFAILGAGSIFATHWKIETNPNIYGFFDFLRERENHKEKQPKAE